MQYGKESAEFLASVALASRLTRGTCANARVHNTVSYIKYVALHACICEPRSVFGTDLTHELFLLEAEKGDNAGITRPSQLAHHRLEVHHPGAAKKHELFLEGKPNICQKCKTRFRNVYLPVSAVLVLTLWSHSIEQLQNQGFPPRRNSAVKSERRSVRKINPRRGGSSDMRDAALIYSTDLSPPRRLWISCGPQYFLTGSPNISIPRLS